MPRSLPIDLAVHGTPLSGLFCLILFPVLVLGLFFFFFSFFVCCFGFFVSLFGFFVCFFFFFFFFFFNRSSYVWPNS